MSENISRIDDAIEYKEFNVNTSAGISELINEYDDMSEEEKKRLKEAITETLIKGYSVYSMKQYESLAKILEKLDILTLCPYSEIGDTIDFAEFIDFEYKFSLKYSNEKLRVFPGTNLSFIDPIQGGYIMDGNFYNDISFKESDDISNNNQFNFSIKRCNNNDLLESQNQELLDINEKLKKEQEELLKQKAKDKKIIEELKKQLDKKDGETNNDNIIQSENQDQIVEPEQDTVVDTHEIHNGESVNGGDIDEETEILKHKEYTVKNGDTMWAIVKKHYGLTLNRDIANCINKLVKYNVDKKNEGKLDIDNTPDDIKGDVIDVGQKILLADQLQFRKQIFTRKEETL